MSVFEKEQRRGRSTGVRDSPEEPEADGETSEDPEEYLKKKGEAKKSVRNFFIKLVVLVLSIWLIFTFVFGIFQVYGEYMYPSVRDGDLVLYYRLSNEYCIDDVVAFQQDGQEYVARIAAMGGDVVEITSDGVLMVNGNAQTTQDDYYETVTSETGISYPYTVADDSYFLLYDYRLSCGDSRDFGAVARKDLDGKVVTILRRRGI
jgi:signal peptidase I